MEKAPFGITNARKVRFHNHRSLWAVIGVKMKVAQKLIRDSGRFKPLPFKVEKDRRRNLKVTHEIPWNDLSEDEKRIQWGLCKDVLWGLEVEGKIEFADLLPLLYAYMQDDRYSQDDIASVKKVKEYQVGFSLLSCLLLLKQGFFRDESLRYIENKIKELISLGSKVIEEKKLDDKPKRSIQDAMKDQLSTILGDLQGMEDDQTGNVLAWLRDKNVPKVHIQKIIEFFTPRLEEIQAAIAKKDKQLVEAYSSYSKKDLKAKLSWYESLLEDLGAYARVKQAQRKVRVKKPKAPQKVVAKLKYLSYDEDTKITSIKPETIIGATALFVYNTKYRKLGVYYASEMDKSLTVKGSTILGFDPKTSVSKTLRKPPEQLKDFLNGGKVLQKNFLKNIKAKESPLLGRVNKDCLLLKVF